MATIQEVQDKLNALATRLGEVKGAVEADEAAEQAQTETSAAALAGSQAETADAKQQVIALTDQVVTLTEQLAALSGQGIGQPTIDALMETVLGIATGLEELSQGIQPSA